MREVSSELGGLQTFEKVREDIDCASESSRHQQEADGQPKEAAKTFELV
jgi:hypothetical protein